MPNPPLDANARNYKVRFNDVTIPRAIRSYTKCDNILMTMKLNKLTPNSIMSQNPRSRDCLFRR